MSLHGRGTALDTNLRELFMERGKKFFTFGRHAAQSQQGGSSHLAWQSLPVEGYRELSCLAEGDPAVFLVRVSGNSDILRLTKLLWEERKNTLFRYVDAADLILYQLKQPVALKPLRSLHDRITSGIIKELEEPTDIVSSFFPHPSPTNLDIFVRSRTGGWKRGPEDIVEKERKKRFKSVPELFSSKYQFEVMANKHKEILLLSNMPGDYANPHNFCDLPFPSANVVPSRFSISNQGKISYMGRQCFIRVWNAVTEVLNDPQHRQAIYVYGGKGLGKSYILAALACLLVRGGARVVYLPDCRAMLLDTFIYLQTALIFAFVNSADHCEDIQKCEDIESLAKFCMAFQSIGQLFFIVDQLNALDPESTGEDDISNDKKAQLYDLLQNMSARHIYITSASANHKTFKHMASRDTGDRKIPFLGGMTLLEMSCWWEYHKFMAFNKADKQRVEDLTGCIPLLLNPFLPHHDKPLEFLEPQIWNDEALASVSREVTDFANAQKSESERRIFHDQFVPLMCACLTHEPVFGSGMLMDHRYFYLDSSNCGRYSCGLARQAIIVFLRLHAEERIFLGSEWLQALESYKENPSAIGFIVEQIVISQIASTGVKSGGLNIRPAKIVAFKGDVTTISKENEHAYYVPLKFNFKAIDALYVHLDLRQKIVRLVAIQITVAKWHTDSETSFYAGLERWLHELTDFKITTEFVWIHEGERGQAEVEAKVTELRTKTVVNWPEHKVHWVSIEQVHKDLANTLTKIRPKA